MMSDKQIEFIDKLIQTEQVKIDECQEKISYYKRLIDSLSDVRRRLTGLTPNQGSIEEEESKDRIIDSLTKEVARLRAELANKNKW